MSESLLAMGDYDRISVREALGGGAGLFLYFFCTFDLITIFLFDRSRFRYQKQFIPL
uniref:Uncharacterized protein n=1 Tax=Helianthus annuus TaxID=4232 RepID=A0A251TZU8_HELAN